MGSIGHHIALEPTWEARDLEMVVSVDFKPSLQCWKVFRGMICTAIQDICPIALGIPYPGMENVFGKW